MSESDLVRLRHMLDAAREPQSLIHRVTYSELLQNRMLVLALIKEIEIIGEAAARLSIDVRTQFPDFPWADIIGMRNRLIHAYFDVNIEILWATPSS
jgi:uncharacterized protein with HEPN domain